MDSHQHHFSETPVFAGCVVRALGTNESNTYGRTERKTYIFPSGNQYSRTLAYKRTQHLKYDSRFHSSRCGNLGMYGGEAIGGGWAQGARSREAGCRRWECTIRD